jgi:hypothetical protein
MAMLWQPRLVFLIVMIQTGSLFHDFYILLIFPNCSFELKNNVLPDGSVELSVEELEPGSEISYNVTVEPKLFGIYESTRARVRYNTGLHIEDLEDDTRSGYSTSLGRVRILSSEEYLRQTSYFVKEWAIFLVLAAFVVGLPYNNWKQAQEAQCKNKDN